jgi:hypothetical protein
MTQKNLFSIHFWLFMALLAGFPAMAQERIMLTGKVLDRETGDPLVFASIGIEGETIGTITNTLGEFDFHFPAHLKSRYLIISMLGYARHVVPVSSLPSGIQFTVHMERAFVPLDEIVVEDVLSAKELFRLALHHIDYNFPVEPFYMEGFYRDVKKLGGRYFSLLEAAVKIQDMDYKQPRNPTRLQERVGVIEIRRSLGYDTRFSKYFDNTNLLEGLLLQNTVRYRTFPENSILLTPMVREPDTEYNGKGVYVISSQHEERWRLYLDKESFAILRLEHESEIPQALKKKKNLVHRQTYLHKVIEFREYNHKMYLHYLNMTTRTQWFDRKSMEFKFETELMQHFVANKVLPETFIRITNQERMKRYGLQYQDNPYNKSFWDSYNILKETPLDKKIIEDLEKDGVLEKQFEGKN